MRKIDKSVILSTAYKNWEEQLELEGKPHPRYNSSKGEFYFDVAMNLLHCQQGLCAYTEVQLCNQAPIEPARWQKGRYVGNGKKEFDGTLDHFDESLKAKKDDAQGRKDWLWDNLFMVHTDVNNSKGIRPVDSILKPDSPDYDEFRLLDYDTDTRRYRANLSLQEAERDRVNQMIEILGLNRPNVISRPWGIVQNVLEYGFVAREFPTAQAFCRKHGSN